MTEPPQRPRGRPKGTGKDDSKLLAAVADRLLAVDIKPTTAMKHVIWESVQQKLIAQQSTAATLRRLQEKWAMSHETLKAEALERFKAKGRKKNPQKPR